MRELLISVLLSLHLLAMNVASAAPLYGIWLRGWKNEKDVLRFTVGLRLTWLAVVALVLGIATGFLLVMAGPIAVYTPALKRLPSSAYWYAALELLFSLICLLLLAGCWKTMWKRPWLLTFVALLTATNLLYHFPPLMSVMGKIIAQPRWAAEETIQRPALVQLMQREEIPALTVHFAFSSLAVSGVALLWILAARMNASIEENVTRTTRGAAAIALFCSILQFPIGLWLLVSLPTSARSAVMGGNPLASILFLGSLLAAFFLLQQLWNIALGSFDRGHLVKVCWLLVVLMLLMTVTGRRLRMNQRELSASWQRSEETVGQVAP